MAMVQSKPGARTRPDLLVVGGGKGGVGKTCFAVNTAVEIARRGWRVVLFDADLGCSNIETVLGFRAPLKLDAFFAQGGEKDLGAVLCDTPYPNLRLLPGSSGTFTSANPQYQDKVSLIKALYTLDADVVIVDLEAGTHVNTLDFFLMSETCGVLVITPERTSIDNAFKFLRAALFRRLERFYQAPEMAEILRRVDSLPAVLDGLSRLEGVPPPVRERLAEEIVTVAQRLKPRIVVNKAANAYEAKIACNILNKYVRQWLCVEPENLGLIYFDQYVSEAVNSGVPFVAARPQLRISSCVVELANRLGYL